MALDSSGAGPFSQDSTAHPHWHVRRQYRPASSQTSCHLQHAQYQQAPQAQNHPPPAHLDHRCDGSVSAHQHDHIFSVPAGSSSSGAPQQVPTPPGPPNRAAPTTSINNESRGCFLLEKNNSWQANAPRSNVSDISLSSDSRPQRVPPSLPSR
ncbi:hypothetical protein BC826DRAFT_1046958 [Russula brevipes]|nr:hypothetical protein BC826DRAFT_1046958 [Russula brevipes]